MGPTQYPWRYPANYLPGQMIGQNNPEMSQLMSMFAGNVLSPMFGPENFLPMLTPGMGVMDQYAMKKYQQQQLQSTQNIATANNANLGQRLLAMRTAFTGEEASETNKAQMETMASVLNFPLTKALVGQLVGPENLEAALHGTKGDISQLHNVTARMGYFMRDPDGGRRMDAQSLEAFTKGVYSHIYEEGGDLEKLSADVAQLPVADRDGSKVAAALKEAANVRSDTRLVSDAEFVGRVDAKDAGTRDRMQRVYEKYVQGTETDTIKQAEAIAKIAPAVEEAGILDTDEALISQVKRTAQKRQVQEMHGLMAGQVGQLQEHLFQRGMLPQAIGALKPAERVSLMSENINDETMLRLAEEYGHRQLTENNKDYREALPAEQRKMLEQRVRGEGGFLEELRATHSAVQKFNAGEGGPTSMEDLEQMGGFEAIAGNVDAKKTANALKKYSGVVDAVREIFGDNGNPNAPMPALLAALDQLSQGAAMQVDAQAIEAAMRQMQQVAKEAGIGFEQMAAMSSRMGAMGQSLGIAPITTMQNQVNAMAMAKTMQDTGSFSQPGFGAMNKGQATDFVAEQMMRGDASDNAKYMAGAAYLYKNAKESFDPDSEFVAMMEAYLEGGSGDYEYNGETKNLFEIVGNRGPEAITSKFLESGGERTELQSAVRSPLAMEEMIAGGGFKTQRFEMTRDLGNLTSATEIDKIQAYIKDNKGAPGTAELEKHGSAKLGALASAEMVNMLVDTSDLTTEEQLTFIRENFESELASNFKENLGLDETAAQDLAKQTSAATLGTGDSAEDIAKQNRVINQKRVAADQITYLRTGGRLNLESMGQVYGEGRPEEAFQYAQQKGRQAEQRAGVGLSAKSHPLARGADYLAEAGETGQKITAGGLLSSVMNVIPEQEIAERYVEDMLPGLQSANERINEITYTDAYLQDLANRGDKDKTADTKLKDLAKTAGIETKDLKFVDNKQYEGAGRNAELALFANASDDRITKEYQLATGESGEDLTRKEKISVLDKPGQAHDRFAARQSEIAFLKNAALKSSDRLSDENVKREYARHFNKMPKNLSEDQMREELLASDDYVLSAGAAEADKKGVTTRERLASQIAATGKLDGKLREESSGTEKELKFLQQFNEQIMSAGDDNTRKKLEKGLIDTFGLEDQNTENDKSVLQELDALIANTDPKSESSKEALRSGVEAMMAGYSGPDKAAAVEEAQQLAETLRISSAIAPADAGIDSVKDVEAAIKEIGDINTTDATINASGGTIVIDGVNLGQMLKELQASQKQLDTSDKIDLSYREGVERAASLKERTEDTALPKEEREAAAAELKKLATSEDVEILARQKAAADIAEANGIPVDNRLSAERTIVDRTGGPLEETVTVNGVKVDPREFDKRVAAAEKSLKSGEPTNDETLVSDTESEPLQEYRRAVGKIETALDKVDPETLNTKQKKNFANAIAAVGNTVEDVKDVPAIAEKAGIEKEELQKAVDSPLPEVETLAGEGLKAQQEEATATPAVPEATDVAQKTTEAPAVPEATTKPVESLARQAGIEKEELQKAVDSPLPEVETLTGEGLKAQQEEATTTPAVADIAEKAGIEKEELQKAVDSPLPGVETLAGEGLKAQQEEATTKPVESLARQAGIEKEELQKAVDSPLPGVETLAGEGLKAQQEEATTTPAVPEATDVAQKTDVPKPEKRYTAEEWAKLHKGETEEDGFGDQVEKTPVSPGLPDGGYTRRGDGEWVDDKTGMVYDRYGNPAGGTYSEDGSSWSAGDSAVSADGETQPPSVPEAADVAQKTTETPAVPATTTTPSVPEATDVAQKTDVPKPEKRYTAEEWAKLHKGETEENTFGEQVEKTPWTSKNLPDGQYTRRGGGEWVDDKTGMVYDRYGNLAGGTYSADGSSWEIGDSVVYADGEVPLTAPEATDVAQKTTETPAVPATTTTPSVPEAADVAQKTTETPAVPATTTTPSVPEATDVAQKADTPTTAEEAAIPDKPLKRSPGVQAALDRARAKAKKAFAGRDRARELAKLSGIDTDSTKINYETRGNVPLVVNGQQVDINQLTDDELTNAAGALKIKQRMQAKRFSETDEKLLAELDSVLDKRRDERLSNKGEEDGIQDQRRISEQPAAEEIGTASNDRLAADIPGATDGLTAKEQTRQSPKTVTAADSLTTATAESEIKQRQDKQHTASDRITTTIKKSAVEQNPEQQAAATTAKTVVQDRSVTAPTADRHVQQKDTPITEQKVRENNAIDAADPVAAKYIEKTIAAVGQVDAKQKEETGAVSKTSTAPKAGSFFATRGVLEDKTAKIEDRLSALNTVAAMNGLNTPTAEQAADLLKVPIEKVQEGLSTISERKEKAAKKKAAEETASAVLPGSTAGVTQRSAGSNETEPSEQENAGVRAVNASQSAAAGAISSTKMEAAAAQSTQSTTGPQSLTIAGELSIVNLEKAVITAQNNAGAVTETAGDMPVISSNSH
jgi:DNA-binding phage protein/lambda repressor-like predicted transcriptional regulator